MLELLLTKSCVVASSVLISHLCGCTETPPASGSPAPEPPAPSITASCSSASTAEKGASEAASLAGGAGDNVFEETSICSLTINATFAEFAHFVLAGDALGRTFVWQVPSTKLLLVLPPPELSEQQKRLREEGDCCGCCAKLRISNDEAIAVAASEALSRSQSEHGQQQRGQPLRGAIHAVGTVAEVSVPQEDTDDEVPESKVPEGEREPDALAPACTTLPSYQNAQWLAARPKGKKKKAPTPASAPPPPPQGDQQQVQHEGGIESSLFSGDESDENENERDIQGQGQPADNSALLQSEENLPYIQHAPHELLQQLRAGAQQQQEEQQQAEKTEQAPLSSVVATEAEAARGALTLGAPSTDPATASSSLLTPVGQPENSCDLSEETVALESIPLSPEACKAPVNSPCAPIPGEMEDHYEGVLPPIHSEGAACGSNNCCVVQGRAPCDKKQRGASCGGPSRYVGAMLPLAALDQLWVGYGDGSLAVFSLSTYQLLLSAQLCDPDISKIEYAKYRGKAVG